MESAKEVLAIGEIIRSGKEVGQKEWDRLFETDGYQKYAPVADLLIFNGHPTGYFENYHEDAAMKERSLGRRSAECRLVVSATGANTQRQNGPFFAD